MSERETFEEIAASAIALGHAWGRLDPDGVERLAAMLPPSLSHAILAVVACSNAIPRQEVPAWFGPAVDRVNARMAEALARAREAYAEAGHDVVRMREQLRAKANAS